MKTLIVVSHPYPENSNIIKGLEAAARKLADVDVRNLETLYGNDVNGFDVAAEQAASEAAERIVFLFPIHWFNTTPMLKAYLNMVWTYGWAFGPDGVALKDKELLVVTSAGATEASYSAEGPIKSTMAEVLTPMKASALYVGMRYLEPLAFFESMSADKLPAFEEQFIRRLQA